MQTIDWIVVICYLIATMVLGVYLSKQASKSMEDFSYQVGIFLGGWQVQVWRRQPFLLILPFIFAVW